MWNLNTSQQERVAQAIVRSLSAVGVHVAGDCRNGLPSGVKCIGCPSCERMTTAEYCEWLRALALATAERSSRTVTTSARVLKARTGTIRVGVYQSREHLVVPVVALVEGIVSPSNGSGPELVLASELARAVNGWAGRPVVMNHPQQGGVMISANLPHVLERQSFGQVFSPRVDSGKLLLEAWLDLAAATRVGSEATDVIHRLRTGQTVEVSVGVFMTLERTSGTHQGKQHVGVWRDITPDHLAMLPAGVRGACDLQMGCGAPRAMEGGQMIDSSMDTPIDVKPRKIADAFGRDKEKASAEPKATARPTVHDLRDALERHHAADTSDGPPRPFGLANAFRLKGGR